MKDDSECGSEAEREKYLTLTSISECPDEKATASVEIQEYRRCTRDLIRPSRSARRWQGFDVAGFDSECGSEAEREKFRAEFDADLDAKVDEVAARHGLDLAGMSGKTRWTHSRELTVALSDSHWQKLSAISDGVDPLIVVQSVIKALLDDESLAGGRGFMITVYDPVTQALIDELRRLVLDGEAQSDRFAELDAKLGEQLGELSAWYVWRAWVDDPLYQRLVRLAKAHGVTPADLASEVMEGALDRAEGLDNDE
jgi:hypothetical protein